MLTYFHWDEAKKIQIKMADSKKPILNIFCENFMDWSLGVLLHFHENQSKDLGYQEWVEILMIPLVSSLKSLPPNISAASVLSSLLTLTKLTANWS